MRETVAALQQENAPVEVVLLDDGYQTALGDWCRVNAKFPSGLPAIAQCIRQAGYHPGIWWAPFIAAENSEVWQEHPNWFLRDATGNPSLALFNWNTRCFVLDLTQPEVLRHLEAITRYLTRDVGFSFLKLDFLYAGALPGSRYNPGTNSLSAYRLGLRTIREAAGDAWILGCGAPLLPSVGLVDAMRTSPDVAGSWQDPDPDGSAPALQNAIRANLARGWMQPHWWLNDPDCVFLSDTHPPATPSEREALLTVARLLGGLHFFSDPVHRVPAVAYHTLRDDESCPGTSLRAFRPDSDGLATRAWKATGTGNRHWLAYFNWGDQSKPETFDPQDWPMLPRGPWTVTDLQERHQWRHRRTVSLGLIPAHGLRVLQVQSREPSVKQA
jgi:alpha-galactosidase